MMVETLRQRDERLRKELDNLPLGASGPELFRALERREQILAELGESPTPTVAGDGTTAQASKDMRRDPGRCRYPH